MSKDENADRFNDDGRPSLENLLNRFKKMENETIELQKYYFLVASGAIKENARWQLAAQSMVILIDHALKNKPNP